MEDTQHHQPGAIKAVTKDIFRVRDFKHEFAKFRPPLDGAADKRMFRKNTSFVSDLRADGLCKVGWRS
jgi:hypothetical protein